MGDEAKTVSARFKGVVSGDEECGCFALSPQEYKNVTGQDPKKTNISPFVIDRVNFYFEDVLSKLGLSGEKDYEFEITVTARPTGEKPKLRDWEEDEE